MKALKSSNARDQNAQEGYRVISGPRQQESVFVYTANRMAWQPRNVHWRQTIESIANVQVRRLRNTQGDQSHL